MCLALFLSLGYSSLCGVVGLGVLVCFVPYLIALRIWPWHYAWELLTADIRYWTQASFMHIYSNLLCHHSGLLECSFSPLPFSPFSIFFSSFYCEPHLVSEDHGVVLGVSSSRDRTGALHMEDIFLCLLSQIHSPFINDILLHRCTYSASHLLVCEPQEDYLFSSSILSSLFHVILMCVKWTCESDK